MKSGSLFALPYALSQLRRDGDLPCELVAEWLDSADPSIILSFMFGIVEDARLGPLLPESKWVKLVSQMRNHPFLLLASALALTFRPEEIERLQFCSGVGPCGQEHLEVWSADLWEGFRSVSKDFTEESFEELEVEVEEYMYNLRLQIHPSFFEKVIAPMLLSDPMARSDTVADLGMPFSDSRDRHLSEREEFVAKLLPPQHLRVIDCKQSLKKGVVVLIDRHPGIAYTAISHTYGLDVYTVYDCGCATIYMGDRKARANPAETPCNGHHGSDELKQSKVMNDMLNMCQVLVEKGGVHYAWHDGICIAQYDEEDVNDAIMHMGWIYANAEDTVIFLHYAGQPMAPIGTGNDLSPLVSRWHTRAWTFQEAILSKHRRYCVRCGEKSFGSCLDWQDFEDRLDLFYVSDQSTIEILDETVFFHSIIFLHSQMKELYKKGPPHTFDGLLKASQWMECLESLLDLLDSGLFFLVTMTHALKGCSTRVSKHPGDHINSILALAGVQEFSVHKDENVEQSTLEFFKRMGKKGLEFAVFTANQCASPSWEECSMHHLTWLPSLCGSLWLSPSHLQDRGANFNTSQLEFKVLEKNSHIKLTGPLVCVPVRFYWKKWELQSEERDKPERSWVAASSAEDIWELVELDNGVMFYWKKRESQNGDGEGAEGSWNIAKDISELAELHSPDDGLGIFLYKCPARETAWIASELRMDGKLLGSALLPHAVFRLGPVQDVKPSMEYARIVQVNVGETVSAIFYNEESDDAVVCFEEAYGDEPTAKRMDWREAWAYCYLSRELPYRHWVEGMRKFFFRRTELRDALTKCGKHNYLGLMLCLQEFCDFPTVHTFAQAADLSQRCKVGTFCASLVFPAEVLSCNSADLSVQGFETLVINGDCIDLPVTKAGCFNSTWALRELLVSKRTNFRLLTELEIC